MSRTARSSLTARRAAFFAAAFTLLNAGAVFSANWTIPNPTPNKN
jgi:hypothetical protein